MPKAKVHWTKGPNADEIRKKISLAKMGSHNPLKGKKMPKDWAEKARKGREGKMHAWNKGKTVEEDGRVLAGEKHYAWKGDDVGAIALHKWIYRKHGAPMKCECCGKVCENNHQIHWANRSGEYKRDRDDWVRLCVSCHKRFDMVKLGKAKLLPPKQI